MAVFWLIIFPTIVGFASLALLHWWMIPAIFWPIALVFAFALGDSSVPPERAEEMRILRQQNAEANQRRTQPFDLERETEALLAGGWLTAMRGRTALRDRPSP